VSGDRTERFYGSGESPEAPPPPDFGASADAPYRDETIRQAPGIGSPAQNAPGATGPLGPATSAYGTAAKRFLPRRKAMKLSGPAQPDTTPQAQPGAAPRRRRVLRITGLTVMALVLALAGTALGSWYWASDKITHAGAITDYPGRPAQGGGVNWLVVGSDSRSTLTPAQQRQYHVGSDQGLNTDTMLLLHYGATGPELISIPRDSYVTIPAYTDSAGKAHSAHKAKINSAYSAGGVQLLVETVERATGVRVDHYLEIGFLGVVNIVDSVGGVGLCLDAPVKDSHSGANLPAGCRTLDGTQSLALIRTRYSLANSDISRMANQQKFVVGLAHAALRPGVVLDPFALYPFLGATLDSIAVDNGTGLSDLVDMSRRCRSLGGGKGTAGTVPIADEGYQVSGLGATVLWDRTKAQRLFNAVDQDSAIPAGLLNSLG
jgi:LCP family protein required for cell wall assembly